MITFGCKGCANRREALRAYWVIVKTTFVKTFKFLFEEEGY